MNLLEEEEEEDSMLWPPIWWNSSGSSGPVVVSAVCSFYILDNTNQRWQNAETEAKSQLSDRLGGRVFSQNVGNGHMKSESLKSDFRKNCSSGFLEC